MTERRGSHSINVIINQSGVQINSDITYPNDPGHKEKTSEGFPSVDDARRKIDSQYSLYDKFGKGYFLLLLAQAGELLVNTQMMLADALKNNNASLDDNALRMFGIITIALATIIATELTENNRIKTLNKRSALKDAQESALPNFRYTYPF
jgi:hypothetical protein